MRLDITVTLDTGGTISIVGEGLDAENVNEVFGLLTGYTVESTATVEEEADEE